MPTSSDRTRRPSGRRVRARVPITAALAVVVATGLLAGCSVDAGAPDRTAQPSASHTPLLRTGVPPVALPSASSTPPAPSASGAAGAAGTPDATVPTSASPWHTRIVSTTFWVGEVFDPDASDGSQVLSTYDGKWQAHYGGCDGVVSGTGCETERRTAANGWFPTAMTPRENPFYLDLPYDDVNDRTGFADRDAVVPWSSSAPYSAHAGDQGFSFMKNRWVMIRKDGHVCYGQIEDAGPGQYHDAAYVFGTDDARPANKRYNGAGMDVSPALNGCLGFAEVNGEDDRVDWRFVEAGEVPAGPWRTIVTTSGLTE
ncbi:hypothetical protein [Curtobacterium sp. Leaf261]|uniref:hypothetical protein n=1 Tax=Curtobacterium sp. Leaf261 TaxID=1736311 RepID=UPI000B2FF9A5|nr:hypothetical protein [Curtobacterium sp. Leaf261]